MKSTKQKERLHSTSIINIAVLILMCLTTTIETEAQTPSSIERREAAARVSEELEQRVVKSLPTPSSYINDLADVIDAREERRQEQLLKRLRAISKTVIVVVTVKTTGDITAFDYSLALSRGWKIGEKNGDAALMLVAIDDRKYEIQINRRLESIVTDEEMQVIGDAMRDDFQQGLYSAGINRGLGMMIDVFASKRGFDAATVKRSKVSSINRKK